MIWKINDNYQGGVPDTWYRGTKGSLFVEYKFAKKFPIRSSTLVKPALSKLQKHWIKTAHGLNQKVWAVVGSPMGIVIFSTTLSLEGLLRKELTFFSTKEYIKILLGEVNCDEKTIQR